MARTSKPTRRPKSKSDGGVSVSDQHDSVVEAEDITDDRSGAATDGGQSAAETRTDREEAGRNRDDSEVEALSGESEGSDHSAPTEQEPGSMRRRWIYVAVVGTALVLGAIGAGAVYLTVARGWDEFSGAFDGLEARIAQQEAELIQRSTRIDTLEAGLAAAENRIAELRAAWQGESDRIAELEAESLVVAETAASLAEIGDSSKAVGAELDRVNDTLLALRERIEEVEARPIPIGRLPEEIVNAYDRQLSEVLGAVDERFGQMQEALDARLAAIDSTRELVALSEQDAMRAGNAAAAREALARIVAALEGGMGFAAELAVLEELGGIQPPDALTAVADEGVSTRGELAAAFPDAAREALDIATREAVENGEIGRVRAFLRIQLGIRSLKPREGDSPDAVLSRAEAALQVDDLSTALTEIAALPGSGRDRFTDWITMAERRRDALDATVAISAQLNN